METWNEPQNTCMAVYSYIYLVWHKVPTELCVYSGSHQNIDAPPFTTMSHPNKYKSRPSYAENAWYPLTQGTHQLCCTTYCNTVVSLLVTAGLPGSCACCYSPTSQQKRGSKRSKFRTWRMVSLNLHCLHTIIKLKSWKINHQKLGTICTLNSWIKKEMKWLNVSLT